MLRTSFLAMIFLIVLTIITGIIYTLSVTGIAQLLFPVESNGSLIMKDGKPVGSYLIGQQFDDPKYFWGRPSATSPYPYNASSSSGSNSGPSNPSLQHDIQERIAHLKSADPGNINRIPVDLVTASGSGLDPHISPAAADYQIIRVARARRLEESRVAAVVAAHTERPQFGIFGETRVNVLKVNMALNEME